MIPLQNLASFFYFSYRNIDIFRNFSYSSTSNNYYNKLTQNNQFTIYFTKTTSIMPLRWYFRERSHLTHDPNNNNKPSIMHSNVYAKYV